ncbi:hypothetical protein [Enterococcus alishanensis]
MVKWRLSDRVKRIEQGLMIDDSGVLFVDENSGGTYGESNMTKKQLEKYAAENKYSVIMIDDISIVSTKSLKYQRKGENNGD